MTPEEWRDLGRRATDQSMSALAVCNLQERPVQLYDARSLRAIINEEFGSAHQARAYLAAKLHKRQPDDPA